MAASDLVLQLFSYHYEWLVFIGLVAVGSYWFGMPGLFVAHVMVAVCLFWLDNKWLDAQMALPDWDGQIDRDFVFLIGIAIRIVLINTVLLPVGILAMRISGRVVPWTPAKAYREQVEG